VLNIISFGNLFQIHTNARFTYFDVVLHDSTICGELFEKSVGNYPLISPGLYLHAMLHLNDINISTHKIGSSRNKNLLLVQPLAFSAVYRQR